MILVPNGGKFNLIDEVHEKDKKKKPQEEEKPIEEVKTVKRVRSRSPTVLQAFSDRKSQGECETIICVLRTWKVLLFR